MDRIYKIYFILPNFKKFGFFGKVINRSLEKFMKILLDLFIPRYLKKTQAIQGMGINMKPREMKYIVTLTSIPERIDEIWITIETLFRQSFQPDQIILWLSKLQFSNDSLPQSLLNLKERGLQIEYVADDIKSHKKYFYAFKKFPDSIVITVDDDVYYPKNTLRYLIEAHNNHSNSIIANRAHKITFLDGKLRPYRKWVHNIKCVNDASLLYVPTGVGGVLYPPNSFHQDIFDVGTFKEICSLADDLWIKVATLRNHSSVIITPYFTKDLINVGTTQRVKLVSSNSWGGGNDIQFKKVLDFFNIEIEGYAE